MLENNPPPILDTVEQYFLRHFMVVLSEADTRLPITKVMEYVRQTGFSNTMFMVDIINSLYDTYSKEINDYHERQREKK